MYHIPIDVYTKFFTLPWIDLINGSNSFNQDKLTNDLFDVFDDYAEDIEAATNKTVPKELIRLELEKRIAGYDLNTKYEQVIQKVQTKLTDKQRSFLNFTKGFVDNVDTYIMISMFGVIVSTILIAILSLKALLPVSIICLVIVLVNKMTLPLILPKLMEKVAGQVIKVSLDTKIFNIAFIYLGVLLLIGLVGSVMYHKQVNN